MTRTCLAAFLFWLSPIVWEWKFRPIWYPREVPP